MEDDEKAERDVDFFFVINDDYGDDTRWEALMKMFLMATKVILHILSFPLQSPFYLFLIFLFGL